MATVLKERTGILHAIYDRRAVRAYTGAQPTDDVIRELLDAAVQAPTAMHLEPWAFVVVQDRGLLQRYSDRAKRMLLDDLNAGGELATDAAMRQRLVVMLSDPSFNIFYDAGTLVVICRKPLGPYAEADCWLAAENLMLAACDQHLGTCCIGFSRSVSDEAPRCVRSTPVFVAHALERLPYVLVLTRDDQRRRHDFSNRDVMRIDVHRHDFDHHVAVGNDAHWALVGIIGVNHHQRSNVMVAHELGRIRDRCIARGHDDLAIAYLLPWPYPCSFVD